MKRMWLHCKDSSDYSLDCCRHFHIVQHHGYNSVIVQSPNKDDDETLRLCGVDTNLDDDRMAAVDVAVENDDDDDDDDDAVGWCRPE